MDSNKWWVWAIVIAVIVDIANDFHKQLERAKKRDGR